MNHFFKRQVLLGIAVAMSASMSVQAISTPESKSAASAKSAEDHAHAHPKPITDPIAQIYAAATTPLLWSSAGAPRERAYEAIETLQRSTEHGLNPKRYAIDELYEQIQSVKTEEQLRTFDQLLTAAIWSYDKDLRIGAAHERLASKHRAHVKRNRKLPAKKSKIDSNALTELVAAIESGNLRAHLESLPPVFKSYTQLQEMLETYTNYGLLGGWPRLPADMTLKPGDEHPAMGSLRQRLILTDGLSEDNYGSTVYDESLQAAVQRFQKRHGLAVDGEIGPATLKALNETSNEKVHRISVNLARLRQLPRELPSDHVAVNIPEFKLRMYRDNKETLNMGVVVGAKKTPTPAMQDKIRHIVFNPYWYPPQNISVREILPKVKRDPGYLKRAGFQLLKGGKVVDAKRVNWASVPSRGFPYRFRQVPGKKNSLGLVKFIFPNKQAIYLHDTPSKKLFAKRVRAFSHGCVRLEQPTELAAALMDWDRGWAKKDVLADITGKKRRLRKFNERMAIYLMYQTAAIEDGLATFHQDIYGHDRKTDESNAVAPLVMASLPKTSERISGLQSVASR